MESTPICRCGDKIITKDMLPYTAEDGEVLEFVPPSVLRADLERDVYFNTGMSGSGKSYTCKNLIDEYRRAMPDRRVFVITDVPDDEMFAGCHYLNISSFVVVGETFLKQKAEFARAKVFARLAMAKAEDEDDMASIAMWLEKKSPDLKLKTRKELIYTDEEMGTFFKDALVVFDDYEESTKAGEIEFLRDHLLTKGRHWAVSVIVCNHLTNDGAHFKKLKRESSVYVVYNTMLSLDADTLFKNYVGITPVHRKVIMRKLKEEGERRVFIDLLSRVACTSREAWAIE